jgi:hypothetical protein
VANCAHGFPEGECLICRTLGTGPAGSKAKPTKTKSASAPDLDGLLGTGRSGPLVAVQDNKPASRRPPGPGPADDQARTRRSRFWPAVAVLAVGAVVVWVFAGVFLLALHIAEYVALAGAAGWVGYRIGHARGRRGTGT